MTTAVVVAFDVGTSGVKAVVVDASGAVLGSSVRTYGLETPHPGWVEQRIDVILAALGEASREVIDAVGIGRRDIAGVSLTAQMFSVVPVDGEGRALRPMLSWLDQRATTQAAALRRRGSDDGQYATFRAVLTAKDIVPRIRWLADEEPAIAARTAWYLDCKEAVVAALTGSVAIDVAGASAFRLLDPTSGEWDPGRCAAAGVAPERLPPIVAATAVAGRIGEVAARLTGLPSGTPVFTGAGDVPASQLGAGATTIGDAHLSLGTAVYIGITVAPGLEDPAAMLGPLVHVTPGEEILWLEIATGGAALSWLTRQLSAFGASGAVDHSATDRLVDAAADGMDGLVFAPWLTGERVPLFDDSARAAFVGLSIHHGPGHLIRAVMEGVACQIASAFEYGLAYGVRPAAMRAVGGGSIGAAWTRIIADHLGQDLEIVAAPQDAAARGAAACALVGLGLATDLRTAVPVAIERTVSADDRMSGATSDRIATIARLHAALAPFAARPARPVGAETAAPARVAAVGSQPT